MMGIRLEEAECEEGKDYWMKELKSKANRDGSCENKPIVKKTIAALCAYDDQTLGKVFADRLRDENGVDVAA